MALANCQNGYDDSIIKTISPIINSLASITDANTVSTRLKKMAHHDSLTGLHNRAYFDEQLNQHFLQARKTSEFFALLSIDLDGFKEVNDSYGHQVGDKLLKIVAERIKSVSLNNELIARVGGDEFSILCTHVNSAHQVGYYANRLIKALSEFYKINSYRLIISASIGISCFPLAAKGKEKLIKAVDIALYRAKNNGKNQYQFYQEKLQAEHERKLKIETDVFFAAKREQFYLAYQPQFDLFSKELIGLEALIRWQHPSLGSIFPHEFIPLLENSKKIHEFGLWVIEKALLDIKQIDYHLKNSSIKVAINIASRQIQPRFINQVKALLTEHKINAKRIEFELTETSLINNMEIAPILAKLRKLGISIAIDDFGTGYSSLTRLKDIPADILKIDRSFVLNAIKSQESKYIIENTIDLAHKLNLQTIAEGVETQAQIDLLTSLDCHLGQGYYFAKPLPLKNLIDWLKTPSY